MNIGDSQVGPDAPPYFIAEAGVNHNGDLGIAEDLVDVAADAGADAVKFQTFSADKLVTDDASKASYQVQTTGSGSQYEMLRKYELERPAHERLIDRCADQGITFLSSAFDPSSADMLADLGVPAIKLGSGDLDNHPLLEHVSGLGLPMIVSTGMGYLEEVKAARRTIRSVDPQADMAWLHCTSAYPCAIDDVNLRAMKTMDDEFAEPVGYSDHTIRTDVPALAVAAGAQIVEKHFTLDSSLPGPDHEASLEPDELAAAVEAVTVAHRALGRARKAPTDSEQETRNVARKSLRAARDLEAGEMITPDAVWLSRPADGLSPKYFDQIVDAYTTEKLEAGEPFTETSVGVDTD